MPFSTNNLKQHKCPFINSTFHHAFSKYERFKGEISKRQNGVLVSAVPGKTAGYALNNLQDRSTLFIDPGVEVYEGMIVGENSRGQDMAVNPCKEKKLTNIRASGTDEAIRLTPPIKLTLEQALEFISDDELVEITPHSIRLRKKFLTENERSRNKKQQG